MDATEVADKMLGRLLADRINDPFHPIGVLFMANRTLKLILREMGSVLTNRYWPGKGRRCMRQ